MTGTDTTYRIPLTQAKTAVIDAEDARLIAGYTWVAKRVPRADGRCVYYAVATPPQRNGLIQTQVHMHRLVLRAVPGVFVDHIDGDGLNNRKANLRFATPAENSRNQHLDPRNRFGFKGVTLFARSGKYRATIYVDGRSRFLGDYVTPEDAARAYNAAAIANYGPFAKLNDVDERTVH